MTCGVAQAVKHEAVQSRPPNLAVEHALGTGCRVGRSAPGVDDEHMLARCASQNLGELAVDWDRQAFAGLGLGDFDQPTDDVPPLHGQHVALPLAGVKCQLHRQNHARTGAFAEALQSGVRPRFVAFPAA